MSSANEDVLKSILKVIGERGCINSVELAEIIGASHNATVGYTNSLKSAGDIIEREPKTVSYWELTDEGKEILKNGSHEYNVMVAVNKLGKISIKDLPNEVSGNADVGMKKAMVNKWVKIEKSEAGDFLVGTDVKVAKDEVQNDLISIENKMYDAVNEKNKNDYKKRKLIKAVNLVTYDLKKGPDFKLDLEKQETELTAELIASGEWKNKTFKNYNFDAMGVPVGQGNLHPLLKMREEFRQIFLEMGFEEMPTNRFVESSFWNFDALFQPQQHPARDAHDTFFVSHPKECNSLPDEMVGRVAKVHSEGGYGSIGYQYDWQLSEAKKNLLRTHTTAVSARMLTALAKNTPFTPAKYFSIDRVFRNETLDATHLAEFHQVEGVIADRDINLGHLLGVIKTFFQRLDVPDVLFKPAYNPYTEPSAEVFGYHQGLKKWVEVGNSGMFRPEMLQSLGLPPDVSVIAWGLSLERPAMIKYNINNIRSLVSHRVPLDVIYNNPICRM